MSKIKIFGFFIVLVVAILITFFTTKYFGKCLETSQCEKVPKKSHHEDSPQKSAKTLFRLTSDIIPINYHLIVQPFMRPDQLIFKGNVSILINCKTSTNLIQLHADEIEIEKGITLFNPESESELKISRIYHTNEILNIELPKKLVENQNYTIFLPFNGSLAASLHGFYRSTYTDVNSNETRIMAMTHFEALNARSAFPCFDEPAFKATYDVELIHWTNMTAISNMPNISTTNIDSEWTRTKFDKTVKMSTYLVAWAVGDFAFKSGAEESKPKFRIVTRPSEVDTAEEAIIYGPKILANFENYFDIKFPLPKMDMLAAPDFAASAMENFGLIIYRETVILFDKKFGSSSQIYLIIYLMSHELSHQWFGNLVTPGFWQDIWLNEGFATYMTYVGIDSVKPDWNVFDRFVVDKYHDVLYLDSMRNSHSISYSIKYENDIEQLFDPISYSKGASIIRMMVHILGEKTFKEGLHNYLEFFKYRNADQSDLWHHLQEAYNKYNNVSNKVDVKKVMDSWTLREGYPLVTIKFDNKTNEVHFSQKRFLQNFNEKEDQSLTKIQYEVPVTYTTMTEQNWEPVTRLWLHSTNESKKNESIKLVLGPEEWIIANLQEVGFYRVNYDERNWNLLIDQLRKDHTKIHRINRAQILDDLFNLAHNGVVKFDLPLNALSYIKNEKESLPLTIVTQVTNQVDQMLLRTELYSKWKKFIKDLIKPAYDRFELKEIDGENFEDNKIQELIVHQACAYNIENCVLSSTQLFNEFKFSVNKDSNSKNNIPPNIRSSVYCTAIAHGDESEWDFIFNLYKKEQNAVERTAMLKGLTCSRDPLILRQLLTMMLEETAIRRQDGVLVFTRIARQNYGREIAFAFLKENWRKIYQLQSSPRQIGAIISSFSSMNTEFYLKEMKQLIREMIPEIGPQNHLVQQTIEKIETNIAWMKKYKDQVADFLSTFYRNDQS